MALLQTCVIKLAPLYLRVIYKPKLQSLTTIPYAIHNLNIPQKALKLDKPISHITTSLLRHQGSKNRPVPAKTVTTKMV